jgi:hypothetical protein
VPPINPEAVRTESIRVETVKARPTPEHQQSPVPTPEPGSQPAHPVVTSNGEAAKATGHAPDSLFRRIFDKFFKAA